MSANGELVAAVCNWKLHEGLPIFFDLCFKEKVKVQNGEGASCTEEVGVQVKLRTQPHYYRDGKKDPHFTELSHEVLPCDGIHCMKKNGRGYPMTGSLATEVRKSLRQQKSDILAASKEKQQQSGGTGFNPVLQPA